MLSAEQLHAIMPNNRHPEYLPYINAALEEFEINTPLRQAAFLAQLAHESGELRYMEEIADGHEYEGRKDLGNTFAGDGKLFKGRGPIQLTGRANYKKYGELLGIDLLSHPKKAATPEVGFRIAGAFWNEHDLNDLADLSMFKAITKKINGGYNGLADREKYYERARKVLLPSPAVTFSTNFEPLAAQVEPVTPAEAAIKGSEADTSTPAPPKPENPKPQDVTLNLATAEDKTSKKSLWTLIGTAGTAFFAWITANIGEAFGWIKNLDINQFIKWLMICTATVAIVFMFRQMIKMVIALVGNILYNLKSMESHANPETNNVKIASPAPAEETK